MARKVREWFPGAIYHIMARGNYKQNIYREKEDYEVFLYLLEDCRKRYNFKIHSFCLMTNHYHILMETGETEIWKIMKRINHLYAAYYNDKYEFIGHLFQGRYKSCLVKDDAYFLQVSRYIHLNPVKARMVNIPEDYEWSSYTSLIGTKDMLLVTRDKLWSYFLSKSNIPKLAYRNFVEENQFQDYEKQIQDEMGEDEQWLPW